MSLGNEFETDNNKEKSPKHKSIIKILIISGAVIVVLAGAVLGLYLKRNSDYNNAIEMHDNNKSLEAAQIFEKLGDFKDSKEYLLQCNYLIAADAFGDGDYEQSAVMLEELGDYEQSAEMLIESQNHIKYNEAKTLMDDGEYAEAQAAFLELKDFEDSSQMAEECRQADVYNQAIALMESDDFDAAKLMFESVPDYKESDVMALVCSYKIIYLDAVQKYEDEEFIEAWELLTDIMFDAKKNEVELSLVADEEEFNDIKDECAKYEYYAKGIKFFDEGKYYYAYNNFVKADIYDSEQRAQDCIQPFKSGEIYSNPDYSANEATIIFRSQSEYTNYEIIKIHDGNTMVSMVAIKPGETVTINIPKGVYSMRCGAGTMWFGEQDFFGSEGYYYQIFFPLDMCFNGRKDKIIVWSVLSSVIDIGQGEKGNLTNVEMKYSRFKGWD